jgi:Cadherin domain
VPENSPVGTFVAHVTVIDEDSGLNGQVNCTLNCVPGPASTFNLVQRYATEYQLITGAVLDRERTEQFMVTIKCQDGGGNVGSPRGGAVGNRVSRVSEKPIRVIVGDVNDNTPVFSQQTYKGTVIEHNYIGVSVLQVQHSKFKMYEDN